MRIKLFFLVAGLIGFCSFAHAAQVFDRTELIDLGKEIGQTIKKAEVKIKPHLEKEKKASSDLRLKLNEFKRADDPKQRSQEFGDLLFTLVNVARRLGIDSEAALREANKRFYRRFSHMEEICRQRGVSFGDLSSNLGNSYERGSV